MRRGRLAAPRCYAAGPASSNADAWLRRGWRACPRRAGCRQLYPAAACPGRAAMPDDGPGSPRRPAACRAGLGRYRSLGPPRCAAMHAGCPAGTAPQSLCRPRRSDVWFARVVLATRAPDDPVSRRDDQHALQRMDVRLGWMVDAPGDADARRRVRRVATIRHRLDRDRPLAKLCHLHTCRTDVLPARAVLGERGPAVAWRYERLQR